MVFQMAIEEGEIVFATRAQTTQRAELIKNDEIRGESS